jgi:hypothetical protein
MSNADELKRARARIQKRGQRAYWKSKGFRRLSEAWVHPVDFPSVAAYIDKKNRERVQEGRRPPRLAQPDRPRGGVTIYEAAKRLNRPAATIMRWLTEGRLKRLPKFGRISYIPEACVKAAELAFLGLDTRGAARYLTARGLPVMPRTLMNWRTRGSRGPRYISTSTHAVRYSWDDLDLWLKQRRKEKS